MIKIERVENYDDLPVPTDVASICRFCLGDLPGLDMMWLHWADWKVAPLNCMYEKITHQALPDSKHISELCCPKCSDLLHESYATLQLFERSNTFWSSYVLKAETDESGTDADVAEAYAECILPDDADTESDQMCSAAESFKGCVELMIQPATMDDLVRDDDGSNYHENFADSLDENAQKIKALTCGQCLFKCYSSSALSQHIENKHPSSVFDCKFCENTFDNIIEYQEHQSGHTDTPDACVFCAKNISSPRRLHKHLTSCHRGETTAQCNVCGKVFADKQRLYVHIQRHNKEKYECDICKRKFSMRNYIVSHMETHSQAMRYTCEKCNKRFRTMNSFYAHKKSYCTNRTTQPRRRRDHKKLGDQDYLYCNICDQPYLAVLNLQRHYKRRHIGQYDTVCLDCNQMFETVDEKCAHRATAHPNLQCPICKQMLLSQESLQSHISNHSKQERPFTCTVCGASFIRLTHLKSHHRRVHTTERPFKCATCGHAFAENFSLTEHVKLKHSSDLIKPYRCEDCGKRFLVKSALAAHMFVHTGIGRFKCDKCPMVLRKAANLQHHHAIYHPV